MIRRIAIAVVIAALVLLGVFWAGFKVDPPVDPPEHGPGGLSERTVLYDGLTPALQFYLQQTAGRAPWVTTTAVIWGTGRLRWSIGPVTLWLPLRWYEAIDTERGYTWRAEITWWNRLLFSIEDRRLQKSGQVVLAGEEIDVPCLDEVQNLRTAAERLWLPSTLITDSRIHWSEIGSWMLSMRYEAATGDTTNLTAAFNGRTRALSSFRATTCDGDSTSAEWFLELDAWDNLAGVTVPVSGTLKRDGAPIYSFNVAGMAYNTDVERFLTLDDAFSAGTQRRGGDRR